MGAYREGQVCVGRAQAVSSHDAALALHALEQALGRFQGTVPADIYTRLLHSGSPLSDLRWAAGPRGGLLGAAAPRPFRCVHAWRERKALLRCRPLPRTAH